ncbi:MAG TPA: hypothetical protein VGV35_09490 [Bryobacteraceae bacterium]|nr:hypothetical protein [Bryobacteraceae bacterium]
MLFSSMQFFAFLPIMLAGFWLGPSSWRKWILLAGSYYFYCELERQIRSAAGDAHGHRLLCGAVDR